MKYYKSDFLAECVRLPRTPLDSQECYNKLVCLAEQEKRRNPNYNSFWGFQPYSKRRNRIVKMYWAYKKMGK